MLVLTSVPGSGTHFVLDQLFHDWKRGGLRNPGLWDQDKIYYSQHSYAKALSGLLELAEKHTLIIPLRHPMAVAQTTKNRGQHLTMMVECFRTIIDYLDKFDPCYLPLDRPDRQEYLTRLNERCGTKFETDWPVIRHETRNDRQERLILEGEASLVNKLMEDPFFSRFGYE